MCPLRQPINASTRFSAEAEDADSSISRASWVGGMSASYKCGGRSLVDALCDFMRISNNATVRKPGEGYPCTLMNNSARFASALTPSTVSCLS